MVSRAKKIVYRYRNRSKKKTRRAKDKRVPLLTMAGLGVALKEPIVFAANGYYEQALYEVGKKFTGYDSNTGQFDPMYALQKCYAPIIIGGLGSKAMTKIGVNRQLKKIPFVGKYIKL